MSFLSTFPTFSEPARSNQQIRKLTNDDYYMKRLANALLACVASSIVTSCENDSPGSPAPDLSAFAKDYLTLKVRSMSANSMASPAIYRKTMEGEYYYEMTRRRGRPTEALSIPALPNMTR